MMGGWAVARTNGIERDSLFSPVAFNAEMDHVIYTDRQNHCTCHDQRCTLCHPHSTHAGAEQRREGSGKYGGTRMRQPGGTGSRDCNLIYLEVFRRDWGYA
jgi:hypothetical protein